MNGLLDNALNRISLIKSVHESAINDLYDITLKDKISDNLPRLNKALNLLEVLADELNIIQSELKEAMQEPKNER